MDTHYLELITQFGLPLIIGLVFGLLIRNKPQSKSSVLTGSGDELKLKNEVLKDQVKQLESKIKTLERALEITSKN